MAYEKFGQDRHHPPGQWVQTSHLTAVAGIPHRKEEARRFCAAVKEAERRRAPYGLILERQPNNRHDPNAIAIFGVATVFPWFRKPQQKEWHIGFVPRDLAAELVSDLLEREVSIAVELYSIFIGQEDYIEVKFLVLAPPGYGVKKRSAEL